MRRALQRCLQSSCRGIARQSCRSRVLSQSGYSCPFRRSRGSYAAQRHDHAAAANPASRLQASSLSEIPTSSTPLRQLTTVSAPAAGREADDGFVAPPPEEWANFDLLMAGCEPVWGPSPGSEQGSPQRVAVRRPLRVAMLLSGGVDSSLALRLLVAAGHNVTAFYLQIWFQEDFRNFWDACPWEEDLEYAQKVCDSLGVPLEVVPLTTQYWDRVVSHSVDEIRAGRTPNPDIWCNSRVKFGAFYDYLDTKYGTAYDRVASGHYARVERRPSPRRAEGGGLAQGDGAQGQGREATTQASGGGHQGQQEEPEAVLLMTPDAVKDQTYFLANLSTAQLSRVMFPLGCLTKTQVRKLAAAADLANKDRKDSQGICFLGKVKFHEFVREHLGEWPGPILEAETGQPLGVHGGYWFYTVGQRGGIKLPGGPWYVVAKDPVLNAVLVSRTYYDDSKARNVFACGPINWLCGSRPRQEGQDDIKRPGQKQADREGESGEGAAAGALYVKVRHGPNMYRCQLTLYDSAGAGGTAAGQYGRVVLEQNDQGLAPGQYAVFYQDGVCLGSAVIVATGEGAGAEAVAAAGVVGPL